MNTEVWAISFSEPHLARRWIQETCSPFRLLLDPERTVYRAYGLRRSYVAGWSPKTVWFYIRLLLSGRKWRGIQGDSAQLGGDFILDKEGTVRLAYPSRDAADRPPLRIFWPSCAGLRRWPQRTVRR